LLQKTSLKQTAKKMAAQVLLFYQLKRPASSIPCKIRQFGSISHLFHGKMVQKLKGEKPYPRSFSGFKPSLSLVPSK
jgi:hypothetical protein